MATNEFSNLRITRSRSTTRGLVLPYAEPEREMSRLRQSHSTPEPSCITIDFDASLSEENSENHVTNPSSQPNNKMNTPPTPIPIPKCLKDYSSPTPRGFANAIVYPNEHTSEVLHAPDVWLVQSVCKFCGLDEEDPIQHIKDFLKIVDTLHTDGATRDTSRLRFFPFTLYEKAQERYDKLPSESIFTWEQLISKFYEKFFPPGKISAYRDRILRFRKGKDEPFHKSWIRFKDSIRQVPHHGIKLWLLIQIFYDNISFSDRNGINQSRKGRLANLSAEEGWDRIEEYAHDQDDTWDEPESTVSISEITSDRLRKVHKRVEYLAGAQLPKQLSNPYLICDYCGAPHEAEECGIETTTEHACLSGGDIYADPSLLPFYQNDDYTLWGNLVKREEGEEGPEFKVRSTFEDDLGHFT
jgi:hypothetical protein